MRILVIGLGSIGLRHARNLLTMRHEVFGFDPDSEAQRRANECGVRLMQTGMDACIIASPTAKHAEHFETATCCGWHALVEKPLANAVNENLLCALKIVETGNRLVVQMGNNLRFNRCVQWVRKMLPEIGTPIWAYFMVAQRNDKYYKDHVLLNWLSHECDLALHLLGPAKLTSCVGNEEICDMTLLHDTGCRTTVHGDYLSVPYRRHFNIHGTNGYLGCDVETGVCGAFDTNAKMLGFFEDGHWPDLSYIDEMREFIAAIEGKKPATAASVHDGLATLNLLLEAQRMLVEGVHQ